MRPKSKSNLIPWQTRIKWTMLTKFCSHPYKVYQGNEKQGDFFWGDWIGPVLSNTQVKLTLKAKPEAEKKKKLMDNKYAIKDIYSPLHLISLKIETKVLPM